LLPVQALVQPKLLAILEEVNSLTKEREEVAHAMAVALVAKQHLLQVGPGGTGKSQIARAFAQRISNSRYFETAFDETTTPDQVVGPPDIRTMVEEGRTRRVVDNMLPDADIAFLDEFFNANGPVLHSIMPLLNERVFHNGEVLNCPLRTVIAGTNKLTADKDQAALWDRIHIRVSVDYIGDRDNQSAMLTEAIARSISSYKAPALTTVSLEQLDAAFDEAMQIVCPQATLDTFLDLLAKLKREGIIIGDRRKVEGLKAVYANAWLAGHDRVRVGDLGILQHMFWIELDQMQKVRSIILDACNPSEKAALTLLDDLNELTIKFNEILKLDKAKRNAAAIDLFKKTGKVIEEAGPLRDKAVAGGASTMRVDAVTKQAETLKDRIATEIFGLSAEEVAKVKDIRR
jgi:MoxR-like ATPase